jgi:putative hydrolase of the HAD superfamily
VKLKVRAVGFDLGDTLLFYRDTPLNWVSLYPDALRAVAKCCGASVVAEQFRAAEEILTRYNTRLTPRTHEVRAEEILGLILAAWELDGRAFIVKAVEEFFAFFQQRMSAFPETHQVLTALRQQRIPTGILTDVPYGMPRDFVEKELHQAGIAGLVDVLLTSVEVGARKPETAGYFALAERLGIAPREMLYVGNEPKDVIGATRAGMAAVFLDRAGHGGNHGQRVTISTLAPVNRLVR